ncbi:ABC transporter ATP-binding protein [uncultured Demequina sp.]|uniref:ABC transporter ATP-binding protein n=1 Tax=uncultured Demequina sp. TaxID=693499 RepID=UPI0025F433F4|nr:ABC transporter ATP-binding protein [uncultured Demequina sp.]
MSTAAPILRVEDLDVDISTHSGDLAAVRGVNFEVREGETMALLGESGCGKSLTASAIADVLDPVAHVTSGRLMLDGVDMRALTPAHRRGLSGSAVGIVFQDALTALNPVYTVGRQLGEPFRIHRRMSARAAREEAIGLLERVGIPDAARRVDDYPHEFSGGMRQRLLIAIAIALSPRLLIADEPTTALDVTVQAQIMDLLRTLRGDSEMAVVLITHDLAVVSEESDQVTVMYAGVVVEQGQTQDVLSSPRHPYTRGLLDSLPERAQRGEALPSIPGNPPDLRSIPAGCVYQDRCPLATEVCRTSRPRLSSENGVSGQRAVACHFPLEGRDE